ncbi:DsbC family protein [Luteimonas vadosa]|uniref:Thiol:disulfide interchange protein n=1 Tax=Luteimonas vadosa TaxID=1165507 RepID=A0ABP9DN22_9GAMM
MSLLLGVASLSACAQSPAPERANGGKGTTPATSADAPAVEAGTPDARALAAIRTINEEIKVDRIAAAPLPGFREVVVGGQVLYVSDDGRYLVQGTLYDVKDKKDLSQVGLSVVRRELLDTVPTKDRIIFAPPSPKYTVAVFTDVGCSYCRKLHQEIAEYNKQGIAVEYLAFPRMGVASEDFKKMEAVWCSQDRRKALTDAKNDRKVVAKQCKNPVRMQYEIGQRAGLTGTPMIITESGVQMPGYMPPEALRAALDKLAAEGEAGPGAAVAGGH